MVFLRRVLKFSKDNSGAVTVDWVVLTSAIVLLAVAVISTVRVGIDDNATDIGDAITAAGASLNPVTT